MSACATFEVFAVRRTSWSADGLPAGLSRYSNALDSEAEEQVREDLRGPGGPPYSLRNKSLVSPKFQASSLGACQDSRLSRRLGQHFLSAKAILERIAEAACPDQADLVVEIGPGKGSLTSHLLGRASRVIAIEIDPVLVQYLRSKFRDEPRLTLIDSDVLKADLSQWGSATVVGNIPYYITSPIISKALALGPGLIRAVFLVQKEVAERLTARPGTRDWGFLSVQTQLLSDPELLFPVPASAFHPPPKVDSAIVRLLPKHESPAPNSKEFLDFVSLCFRQKRKKIRNNLLGAYDKSALDSIPATAKRAEQLSIPEFLELHAKVLSYSKI